MIHLENVSKHFLKHGQVIKALDEVSLHVPKGQMALLKGPSGSGKTTLINIAAGLCRPTAGSVAVVGEPLNTLSQGRLAALRSSRVAVVFQMFHLVPYLTALENVLLPTLANSIEDAFERANQLLSELGIAHRAGHYPSEMSSGECQRCTLARALLVRPEVILADEPTGNLDEESARHVLDKIKACCAEGTTVLLVSHESSEKIHADLQFNIKNGKLIK